MHRSFHALVGVTAVTALVGAGTAAAAPSRDIYIRHHLSFTQTGVFEPGNREGLSVNFVTPSSWLPVKRTSQTHLSFHVGTTPCRYSVTVTTRLAADDGATAREHVTAELPAPTLAYVLDQGVRNTGAAWRVTRLKVVTGAGGGRVQLRAMRADRRAAAGAWQETIVSASSRASDECHAGTYRNGLGPQIGDALATATGRAYSFAARNT